MDPDTISIRPLRAADLPAVERDLSPDRASKHAQRLRRQERDEGLYLIVWDGRRPVGHVFIEWESEPFGPPELALHTVPYFLDFYVLPEYRSQGIGSHTLAALEQACAERGYRRVCCAVAATNTRAHALYERHGYRDPSIGLTHFSYSYLDEDGRERTYEEDRYYLLKQL
jgi:GNAT superfamily N-acetyltransferase